MPPVVSFPARLLASTALILIAQALALPQSPGESPRQPESATPASTSNQQVLADSENDFSNQQGKANWSYLYYVGARDGSGSYGPDDALPMKWEKSRDNQREYWAGPLQWYQISKENSQPQIVNGCFQGWTVRRWTSDRAGEVHIAGHVASHSAEGDGICFKVFVDGKELFSKTLSPKAEADIDLASKLNKGSRIDFAVTPGPALDANYDNAQYKVSISAVGK